jgi:hypothetical protein
MTLSTGGGSMEDILFLVDLDTGHDLVKGKSNRDGLIQQVVTYVRDGHTVTRKQWVRSEFADHAKKNEEEKKKTILEEQQRADNKHKKQLQDVADKKKTEDKRTSKKVKARAEKLSTQGRVHKVTDKQVEEYKKKLKQKAKEGKKEEKERKEAQTKSRKKDEKKGTADSHSRFGQSDQTRAESRAQQKLIQ